MSKNIVSGLFIPLPILKIEKLSFNQKGLLSEILYLSKKGDCRATNKHLAGFLGISESNVGHSIPKFEKMGLITITSFDGRNRSINCDIVKKMCNIEEKKEIML